MESSSLSNEKCKEIISTLQSVFDIDYLDGLYTSEKDIVNYIKNIYPCVSVRQYNHLIITISKKYHYGIDYEDDYAGSNELLRIYPKVYERRFEALDILFNIFPKIEVEICYLNCVDEKMMQCFSLHRNIRNIHIVGSNNETPLDFSCLQYVKSIEISTDKITKKQMEQILGLRSLWKLTINTHKDIMMTEKNILSACYDSLKKSKVRSLSIEDEHINIESLDNITHLSTCPTGKLCKYISTCKNIIWLRLQGCIKCMKTSDFVRKINKNKNLFYLDIGCVLIKGRDEFSDLAKKFSVGFKNNKSIMYLNVGELPNDPTIGKSVLKIGKYRPDQDFFNWKSVLRNIMLKKCVKKKTRRMFFR